MEDRADIGVGIVLRQIELYLDALPTSIRVRCDQVARDVTGQNRDRIHSDLRKIFAEAFRQPGRQTPNEGQLDRFRAERAADNIPQRALFRRQIADVLGEQIDLDARMCAIRKIVTFAAAMQLLALMPEASDYRPMHGRSKGHDLADGTHTRVKIDLFPEYIRNLPAEKRALWDIVGRALCSEPVKLAFIRRLAPGLSKRFGKNFAKIGMYPIPILTRDIPGYLITPHTDTRWKGITVQLYLPKDASATHIGTIFHEKLPDGSLPKRTQMRFAPNTGYAFAVGTDTWHSADPVHNRVKTRDSILLTYCVDQGVLKVLRNRGKRVGNFVLNEFRHRI